MGSRILLIGTRNLKKGRELFELLLPPWEPDAALDAFELQTLDAYPGAPPIEETGQTFMENARLKATTLARTLGAWTLGEDSGLLVDALKGRPGIYSARYSGPDATDERNNAKLLAELAGVSLERRTAHYVCTAALADPSGTVRAEAQGRCSGRIRESARGTGGFGYDPLFEIVEYHKTFGELAPLVKQQISHRARAMYRLRPQLLRELVEGGEGVARTP